MCLVAKDSKNCKRQALDPADLGAQMPDRRTYNLQLILPKLLLVRFVKKWKLANMVNEDVSQDGQLGLQRRYLSIFRPERGAKALECRRRVEFADFPFHLL